jgi:hypothetical protein
MLLCAGDDQFAFVREDVAVTSLKEGGNIWTLDEVERAATASTAAAADWAAAPWFQTAWPVNAVEVGSAHSVLATDPYYARSYASYRRENAWLRLHVAGSNVHM